MTEKFFTGTLNKNQNKNNSDLAVGNLGTCIRPAPEKLLPQFDITTYLEMLQRVIANCLSSQTFSGG